MNMTRRTFLGGSLALACGCASRGSCPRHVSDYNGVQVGVISYSYRSMPRHWTDVLRYLKAGRLGTVELMGNDAETAIGLAPRPKDKASQKVYDAAAAEIRRSADFGRFRELKREFDDAGIDIPIVKFGTIGTGDPALDDYYCKVAQALGARAITREIPGAALYGQIGPRLAELTKRYGLKVAFHNHLQINATTYDGPLLDYSDNLMINFDMGHYVAAGAGDPLAFARKYHDRIFSVHLKDRTTPERGRQNLPFGLGDTPLGPFFAQMRENGWDWPCDIELEYAIPAGSDACREVGLCNRYCRNLIG